LFGLPEKTEKRPPLSEKAQRWNRLIERICSRDPSALSGLQKTAVLCFWYDAEVNSGGHSGYFDQYSEINPTETESALRIVGGEAMARNFREAVFGGEADEYVLADAVFGEFSPSLCACLMDFVELHRAEILEDEL